MITAVQSKLSIVRMSFKQIWVFDGRLPTKSLGLSFRQLLSERRNVAKLGAALLQWLQNRKNMKKHVPPPWLGWKKSGLCWQNHSVDLGEFWWLGGAFNVFHWLWYLWYPWESLLMDSFVHCWVLGWAIEWLDSKSFCCTLSSFLLHLRISHPLISGARRHKKGKLALAAVESRFHRPKLLFALHYLCHQRSAALFVAFRSLCAWRAAR